MRREVAALLDAHRGVLKAEHFDSGVICHLQRRTESAAAAALREIGRRTDFTTANNKPAYLTHWLMKLAASEDGSAGSSAAAPDLLLVLSCCEVARRTQNARVLRLRSHALPGREALRYAMVTMSSIIPDARQAATSSRSAGRPGSQNANHSGSGTGKPDLRRLPRATASAIEKLVESSPWIEWRHLDAGVLKVSCKA